MAFDDLKKIWLENYKTAPEQLSKMSEVKGLVSAFNANIDAVIKVSGKQIEDIVVTHNLDERNITRESKGNIKSVEDAFNGFLHCFKNGIAEEWLIDDVIVFEWLHKNLGYDKLQMGGQGGIVANVMSVCNVEKVYVHCASLPKEQAELFLQNSNLQSVDAEGVVHKAGEIMRKKDIPLIHWIIEFDKGDKITLGNETYTCPKSNRFIATYDPLNFKLHIDEPFARAMMKPETEYDYIILSGYQMLYKEFTDGTQGSNRIEVSKQLVEQWRMNHPGVLLHLEVASTQDKYIRKYLLDNLATITDSVGFNERELIDLLEVMGEEKLASLCEKETNATNLFKGMLKVFEYTKCPRLQLHMFGLYVTLQQRGFKVTAAQNRNGMQLAAVIAAAKAGTGSINNEKVLLWAKDREVSEVGLRELENLSKFISKEFGENNLEEEGIFSYDKLDVIAVPTILIDKPVTLVGMGDTISSISLVGAR